MEKIRSFVIMIVAAFLLVLSSAVLGHPADQGRIVGGTEARVGDFPHVVSLQSRGSIGGHFCGGSILDKRHVLTAGHCVYGATSNDMQIQYGIIDIEEEKNVIGVAEIISHKDYVQGSNYPNDIAILVLEDDIVLDDRSAKPVNLPDEPIDIPEDIVYSQLCGWGYRTSEEAQVQQKLLWTWLPLMSDDLCSEYLGSSYNPKYHVCAGTLEGDHKQCSGDSGGPLTIDGTQYGVVSWSFKPCTITNRPGIFTNVANYRDWIKEKSGV